MSTERPTLPVPRHPRIWWSRIVWQWPILVWVGVAVLAWTLYERGGDYQRINGMVEVTTESVSPLETGRLIQVNVIPGQSVAAGEILAQLDTSLVDEEISRLVQAIRQDQADVERQFTTARERLNSDLRDYILEESESRKRLEIYLQEMERLEDLVDRGLASRVDLIDARLEVATLENRILLYSDFKRNVEQELERLKEAENRASAFHAVSNGPELESSRITVLQRRRDNLSLRAQRAGVISRVRREPGEVVQAGERVVDILIDRPRRILAFMNETDTRPIATGDIVDARLATGGNSFKAQLVALSPNIIALEDRASPLPQGLVRGRRLELVPLEPVDLTPGAGIIISLPTRTRMEVFWRRENR